MWRGTGNQDWEARRERTEAKNVLWEKEEKTREEKCVKERKNKREREEEKKTG